MDQPVNQDPTPTPSPAPDFAAAPSPAPAPQTAPTPIPAPDFAAAPSPGSAPQTAPTPTPEPVAALAPKKPLSALAVTGFILSFFTGLVGVIVSIIGLATMKKAGKRGKGLAIAGICIGLIVTLSVGGFGAYAAVKINKADQEHRARLAKIATYDAQITELQAQRSQYDSALSATGEVSLALAAEADITAMPAPQDTAADRAKAQANLDLFTKGKKEIADGVTALAAEKVFSTDTDGAAKLKAVTDAWKTSSADFDKLIGGFKAFTTGDFDTYNAMVDALPGVDKNATALSDAITALSSHLSDQALAVQDKIDQAKDKRNSIVKTDQAQAKRNLWQILF